MSLDYEIMALKKELANLKIERKKVISKLPLIETRYSLHARDNFFYDILVYPTNPVVPLISWYVDFKGFDVKTTHAFIYSDYALETIQNNLEAALTFIQTSGQDLDIDLVFVSTSVLNIEVS